MKFTLDDLRRLKPCKEGLDWYIDNVHTEDLGELLVILRDYRWDWCRWLFSNIMDKQQNIELAIFCAESVLYIFEKNYFNDDRPRKAIEASKNWLKIYIADGAASAAAASAAAASAAAASAAAASAAASAAAASAAAAGAYAATAAGAYAATAGAYAATAAGAYAAAADDAATAAAAGADADVKLNIINKAVEILERDVKYEVRR